MWAKQKNQNGFTIVELLIVIVIIGILAAITIVAFNGVQDRANDTKVKSISNQLIKAIRTWNTDSGVSPKGGWSSTVAFDGTNCSDGSGGWVAKGTYICALEDILQGKGITPTGLVASAPKNKHYGTASDGRNTFMMYPCSGTDRFALYWSLASPSTEETAGLSSIEASGCPTAPRITYGMRAATILQF